MHSKKDLWNRLSAYHFNHLVPPSLLSQIAERFGGADASTKAFASKLSRKLGWTTAFALRAIAEYKKFVYLGVTADFSVTPSKVIDQVWHEHLLFTQAYATFCSDVLWVTFNHHPELVPTDEQTEAFRAQYLATLERYRREFNHEPPADIWSVPKFKGSAAEAAGIEPKKNRADSGAASSDDGMPLWMFFDSTTTESGHHHGDGQGDDGCGGDGGSAADGGGSGCSGGGGGD